MPLIGSAGLGACSNSNAGAAAAALEACHQSSDCSNNLICALGACRKICTSSADCDGGGQCIDNGTYAVCQTSTEYNTPCTKEADCPAPLACASDYRCRNLCSADADCNTLGISGRLCATDTNGVHYCAGPADVNNGMIVAPPPPNHPDAAVQEPVLDAAGQSESSAPQDALSNDVAGDTTIAEGGSTDTSATGLDAGPLGFFPSNFDASSPLDGGAIDWSKAPDVIVGQGSFPSPTTIAMKDGTTASLVVLHSLTVPQTETVTSFVGYNGTFMTPYPVIFAVLTTVNVQGAISIASPSLAAASGAFNPGPGVGQAGMGGVTQYPNSMGGGGSYCGVGGHGSATSGPVAPGGSAYGNATLVPLLGGSFGGAASGGTPGSGGGAIQIVAGTSITVGPLGSINAGGAGGSQAGAGGSGGAILLEAPAVVIQGGVAANGGAGGSACAGGSGAGGSASGQPALGGAGLVGGTGSAGTTINGGDAVVSDAGCSYSGLAGGGGGAGRIRINTASGAATITGIVSPSLGTQCATQGTIR